VENICHTLVGAALSKAGLERKSPIATPVLLVAANLPDIDILGTAVGENYLDFHRGITHAAVGIGSLSLGLAAAAWAGHRLPVRDPAKRASFLPLWFLSFVGLLTHPLLDYLNDYGIRPWLPFDGKWYYGDLLSVVDPWIWIMLGASLFLATSSRAGKALWTALAVLLAAVVFWGAGLRFGLVWTAALGASLCAGRALRARGWSTPRLALGVMAVYLAGTAAVHWSVLQSARSVAQELIPERVDSVSLLPGRPGSGHRWTVVYTGESRYYFADVGGFGFGGSRPAFESYPRNLDDPCLQAALGEEQIAVMARFARFPSVTTERSGGNCTVVLRDLRYARKVLSGWGTARATVPAPAPSTP
jgi:inner membrane protein